MQINNLAEFTKDYLDNPSNRFVREQQHYDIKASLKEVTDLKLDQKILNKENFNSSFESAS